MVLVTVGNTFTAYEPRRLRFKFLELSKGLQLNPLVAFEKVNKSVLAMKDDRTLTVDQLIEFCAGTCASMIIRHPDHATLAGRLFVEQLYNKTENEFYDAMRLLHEGGVLADACWEIVNNNRNAIEAKIIEHQHLDFGYSYMALKTLEKSYLLRLNGNVVERPQYMWMRVSLCLHESSLDEVFETYSLMANGYFTHSTPTLFSAATKNEQMASCFLLPVQEDSVDGIYNTLWNCAKISKNFGGVGVNVSNVRANKSLVNKSDYIAGGLVPLAKLFNASVRHISRGGKRPSSVVMYVEPWHADVFDFINLRKNTGSEDLRARDVFTALWIPDEFMRRVESDGEWSLMCPNACPGLSEAWGEQFDELYRRYESEHAYVRKIKARQLWRAVCSSQVETGTPYMLYKDACNAKSNQCNLGTIGCSNLCAEIVQFSSKNETATCNLASVALPKFVDDDGSKFDFGSLKYVVRCVTRNLNKLIDKIGSYTLESSKKSNLLHRPIGIGVQGLADVFMRMPMPYDSKRARLLNKQLFETIYFAALEASCELAMRDGAYATFKSSPISSGLFQFHLWKRHFNYELIQL